MENNNNKIRLLDFDTILYFFMRAFCIGISFNACIEIAKVDAWISIIIGAILGIIPFFMFKKIQEKGKDKNIMELNIDLFGKLFGNIINIILMLFCLSILLITLWNLTNFISSQYLYNTPQLFIAFIFTVPTIYLLSKNYKIMGRAFVIFFIIEIILYLLSFIGLVGQVKFTNIFPMLENGISPIIKASLVYISYNILPLFMLTIFPLENIILKKNKKHFTRNVLFTYIFTNICTFITMFFLVSVFGIELARLYQYPLFQLLRRVEFGGFIQRAEATLSIHWIICIFVFNVICFLFIREGLKCMFNKNKIIDKIFPIFIIGTTYASTLIFKNNTIANKFIINYYGYFMGIAFFIIPIIILLFIKLKKSKK